MAMPGVTPVPPMPLGWVVRVTVSSSLSGAYGTFIRKLREITNHTLNEEPKWHHNRPVLTSGYAPRWPRREKVR
jgi:hypothetical protein